MVSMTTKTLQLPWRRKIELHEIGRKKSKTLAQTGVAKRINAKSAIFKELGGPHQGQSASPLPYFSLKFQIALYGSCTSEYANMSYTYLGNPNTLIVLIYPGGYLIPPRYISTKCKSCRYRQNPAIQYVLTGPDSISNRSNVCYINKAINIIPAT